MAEGELWCWEAARGGHGPDWLLIAVAAPGSEAALAEAAANLSLPGFVALDTEDPSCPDHRPCRAYHLIDASNARAYGDNLGGGPRTNIWVYNLIRIHHGTIEIESGYGGRGDQHSAVETAMLLALFGRPGLTLARWQVFVGGNTYDYRLLREGVGADALRAYLAEGRP